MPHFEDPIAGQWYIDKDSDRRFEVIAINEDDGIVQVRYYDDNTEDDVDIESWYEMDIEQTTSPEEWSQEADSDDDIADDITEDFDEEIDLESSTGDDYE